MSQVHVRQIPIAASTDAQRIVGSWFPTSYYGNFRARSRADLAHHFRQLAQPVAPKRFDDRQSVEASAHVFSQHDNRFRFECDPLVRNTQGGFGRRKAANNTRGDFNPLLISWVPTNADPKTFIDSAKITSYADEYNRDTTPSRVLSETQSIKATADRPIPASLSSTASVYSSAYTHGQPDPERSKQVRRETFQRFLSARTQLSKQKPDRRSAGGGSVASCMVWNSGIGESKPAPTPRAPPPPAAAAKEEMVTIVAPVTLQPRAPPANSNPVCSPPRQRAQSAGPRLVSSAPAEKALSSQSMQTFKTTIAAPERPRTATTTSREHYTGAHFGPRVANPRPTTPFQHTYADRMQNLISKYM